VHGAGHPDGPQPRGARNRRQPAASGGPQESTTVYEGGTREPVVCHESGTRTACRRIELLPNCSLTVTAAFFFFGTVALASLTFALFFALRGAWPVLPWAGAELVLLGWALWASMRRRHWTQTLAISEREVEIVTRGPHGATRTVFSRHWASVRLRARHGWQPSRLLIESHGRACEIGSFLTEEERRGLWRRLAELIGRPSESPDLPPDGSDAGLLAGARPPRGAVHP
jgi:uncharacterized membrane protein